MDSLYFFKGFQRLLVFEDVYQIFILAMKFWTFKMTQIRFITFQKDAMVQC